MASSFFRVLPSVFEAAVAMALHVHLDKLCLTVTVMGSHRIGVVSSCSCNWPGGMVRHCTPISSRTGYDIIVEHLYI